MSTATQPSTTVAAPALRAPIVLVHGLLGFNELKLCGLKVASYFPRIREFLAAAGNRVLVPALPPTCGIAERAARLKAFLDREAGTDPVHLIGHSMGGLDCRFLTAQPDMAGRVLTLTTIATPHRGSTFADWGIRHVAPVVRPVLEFLSLPYQAFFDLTTARCREFNERVLDVAGVRYFSVAGKYEGDWLNPEWQLSHQIVGGAEGANDGVVSLASARYGESCEIWPGDHLSLINWPNPVQQARGLWFDRSPNYARLLGRLKDEGF